MSITIGITDTESSYENYHSWIQESDTNSTIIKLSPATVHLIGNCKGIILSGGVDTHPSFYNNKRLNYPLAPREFNMERDKFELSVFEYSQTNNIPVLAICRGMQLVNIALGGDMIQDIEETNRTDHRKINNKDRIHAITVQKNSLLHSITQSEYGNVNSAHHQALGNIAEDLKVTAVSHDGVAECIEWKDATGKPFLLGVQWHPERFTDELSNSPFSKNIRDYFFKRL